jgi:hypothetical protein
VAARAVEAMVEAEGAVVKVAALMEVVKVGMEVTAGEAKVALKEVLVEAEMVEGEREGGRWWGRRWGRWWRCGKGRRRRR